MLKSENSIIKLIAFGWIFIIFVLIISFYIGRDVGFSEAMQSVKYIEQINNDIDSLNLSRDSVIEFYRSINGRIK